MKYLGQARVSGRIEVLDLVSWVTTTKVSTFASNPHAPTSMVFFIETMVPPSQFPKSIGKNGLRKRPPRPGPKKKP